MQRSGRIGFAILIISALGLLPSAADAAAAADMRVRATGASMRTGRMARFAVTVSNRGSLPTDDVIHMVATLPPGITFVEQRRLGWACTAEGQTVDCVRNEPLGRGRASSLILVVAVCSTEPSVTTTFEVRYAGETDPTNNLATRINRVHAGQCVAGTPTATRTRVPTSTPGGATPAATATAAPPGSPTPTPVPGNPNAPVVTSFTCNNAPQCSVATGEPFTIRFSYSDANANAIRFVMTSRRDDGRTATVSSGSFGSPRASDTITLNFPAFTCPITPCRQSLFEFTVVVSDTTNLNSTPVTVPITVRATGQ